MKILILGRGKTGNLVAEVARQRGHRVQVAGSSDNLNGSALTPSHLRDVEVVLDFTTPAAVIENIKACVRAGKNMVVGTTGWYSELANMHEMVKKSGTGFIYGANFSIGMNLFFEITRTAATATTYGYHGQIFERHHKDKKDAPSGTALAIQKLLRDIGGQELEIISFREGDVVGMHEVVLESPHDTIYVCHDAVSRHGFAEGAVKAAEWLRGKTGFFDFKDIWRDL
jgi:4-hydroxy-tetrahydrodipicolinate reductase